MDSAQNNSDLGYIAGGPDVEPYFSCRALRSCQNTICVANLGIILGNTCGCPTRRFYAWGGACHAYESKTILWTRRSAFLDFQLLRAIASAQYGSRTKRVCASPEQDS